MRMYDLNAWTYYGICMTASCSCLTSKSIAVWLRVGVLPLINHAVRVLEGFFKKKSTKGYARNLYYSIGEKITPDIYQTCSLFDHRLIVLIANRSMPVKQNFTVWFELGWQKLQIISMPTWIHLLEKLILRSQSYYGRPELGLNSLNFKDKLSSIVCFIVYHYIQESNFSYYNKYKLRYATFATYNNTVTLITILPGVQHLSQPKRLKYARRLIFICFDKYETH